MSEGRKYMLIKGPKWTVRQREKVGLGLGLESQIIYMRLNPEAADLDKQSLVIKENFFLWLTPEIKYYL